MIRLTDCSFYYNKGAHNLTSLAEKHAQALNYIDHIKERMHVEVIKHLDQEAIAIVNGTKFMGFKSRKGFFHIPRQTIRHLVKAAPDVLVVQGLIFPLQVIWLRKKLGHKTLILVQHHGEIAFSGIKRLFQRMADRRIDGYLFTSIANATAWIKAGIISTEKKCHELLEASTSFTLMDKQAAKEKLGFLGDYNFLSVGRLNSGKDPLLLINAFELFYSQEPTARLYMVYQTSELLEAIKSRISNHPNLRDRIILVGNVPHNDMELWFNAADYFLSASHHEGSGYALLEAMACGCIPIVTDIPSFRKITGAGKAGWLFKKGDVHSLLDALTKTRQPGKAITGEWVSAYFQQELSFKAIADRLYAICMQLTTE